MSTKHNYLRVYRKRSKLTQADIAFLMKLPDYSSISRWEHGHRTPDVAMLIVYHLLFEIPIDAFYERQKEESKTVLKKRMQLLHTELESHRQSQKTVSRLKFLEEALKRLTH